MKLKHPPWIKVKLPGHGFYPQVKSSLSELKLATVCQSALCPNIAECWSQGTATIMIMGDTCTRVCKFCAVKTGNPKGYLEEDEPERTAEAVKRMKLKYVVITSVDRDDLQDGGAGHFAKTILKVRELNLGTTIEALIPDFRGDLNALKKVVSAKPEVLGQNIETVKRLTHPVRDPRAGYNQTLFVLRSIKKFNSDIFTKSAILLGLGETEKEVIETMQDLRNAGVDLLTLGQYLRPTKKHLPVFEYITPRKFKEYEESAYEIGFKFVMAGPFVRSSYRAVEAFVALNRA